MKHINLIRKLLEVIWYLTDEEREGTITYEWNVTIHDYPTRYEIHIAK